ncbi:putative SWI/SNF-related matrix-associated actin-dependent regulator of chromatin subfamily A member 3-like 2 isoform X2 [Ananas comosus]|uniref:SWI/SNF-related matrix-associated actin-dependent regulator of chromatin subfamily A member 3-like 2 isoform X2 n=1 Tax=Ananas comosus TaxID=4615 RepID=A0A6P5GYK3_ANACO|nr:putative SWI/SNF-related matrix-associated actin-dependent regulator of chromatin subfamily A member 3-like 2 isoform X2 [Ananas comosus]
MGNKANEEQIAVVRSVVGADFSEMDVIRALHMANNDAAAAINIIFDTPHLRLTTAAALASPTAAARKKSLKSSSPPVRQTASGTATSIAKEVARSADIDRNLSNVGAKGDLEPASSRLPDRRDTDWWFVGSSDIVGLSTCKGRRLKVGDKVAFTFPSGNNSSVSPCTARFPGRGRPIAPCSKIVRFSTEDHGEVGRIPNEWARCLLPLVREKKIRIEGYCKSSPDVLAIMDSIVLSVSVYINILMLRKHAQTSVKPAGIASEESTIHPLPTLFGLLGLTPFKKAELTPEDIETRKRPMISKGSSRLPTTKLPSEKCRKLSPTGSKVQNDQEIISEFELDSIIGITDSPELEEMDPPDTLRCDLRPYQKQALHWMMQLEKGRCKEDASMTLHPCWDAYRLVDKRGLVVYLNPFSGDATTEFPNTLQIARGGILADVMGLGKTIMTIALLLAETGKGCLSTSSASQVADEASKINASDQFGNAFKKSTSISRFSKLLKPKTALTGGGNLIVCPMTLLSQWKDEIETHVLPGSLGIYIHYGQSRPKDAKLLAQSDVVLTTYGVLASEFSAENAADNGGLYSVHWFRVVLDEAHTIKSAKSQISVAAAALSADRRWCLSGTPIQNNLEDIYSLLRFLRIEPWRYWALWHKLILKPFEEGDERGLYLVQSILKPIMLRRTKSSTDKEGRPIITLPPANVEVLYCDLSETEKDFYDALFRRSKVKFDQFVEQGRVLHNYASILELLLRLRQCCDHPFLVMSRGDTQEFSDLSKLTRHFLKGARDSNGEDSGAVPSKAYINEVVEELKKGEEGECPICLEAFEDAVLTPCAHRLCRECLLTSWRSATAGLCPVCRCSFSFTRLDGTLNQQQRERVIKEFTEDKNILVLLMSLKAGGVGINLTAASNAFVMVW